MLSLMTPLGPETGGLLRQGAINRDMYLRYVSRFFISARSALPRPPLGTPLRDVDSSHDPLSPETGGLLRQGAINRDMYLRYVSRFFFRARSALPRKTAGDLFC